MPALIHAIGMQTNLFGRITNCEMKASAEIEKKFDAHRKMLEDERKKQLRDLRATKTRALMHDWTIGLHRYGIRHAATMDQVNEELCIEKKPQFGPDAKENNINGTVYSHDNGKEGERFKSLGRITSRREGSNGRQVVIWTMEKYYAVAKSDMEARDRESRVKT